MNPIPATDSNDTSPVPDQMIGKLSRATPEQARQLALSLPIGERAQLAVFCNARTHLRDCGRAIAAACTEAALLQEAGFAGGVLFHQATGGPDTWRPRH